MPRILNLKIEIPRQEVLKRLHYNIHKTELSVNVDNLIDKMMKEAYILIATKAVYKDFIVAGRGADEITLQGIDFKIRGKEVCALLNNSVKVTLLAVTIGEEFPKKSQGYMAGGMMSEAVVLDAVGSEAVEALADKLSDVIARNAAIEGCLTTKRYSPGYGDWKIEDQKGLLKVIGAADIGIDLNPACLMIPEKSISGVVGWER